MGRGCNSPRPILIDMKQPDLDARLRYEETVLDKPTIITIPGTKRRVKMRGVKPYTLERLMTVWHEKEVASREIKNSSDVLKSLCIEPYLSVKEALLFVLNSYWKIRLFYPFLCWWWGKVIGYTEEQMSPIIIEGKKKLPLDAHYLNIIFSKDMNEAVMKMTKQELARSQAEQASDAKRPS